MNKITKAKLLKLETACKDALKDPRRQSMDLWRGQMWAVIAAAHELRKAGILPPVSPGDTKGPTP